MTRKTATLALAACLLALGAGGAAATTGTAAILHLNEASVYIDKGATDGLAEGDLIAVERDGAEIATLQVAYAAPHSASCTVLAASGPLATGDGLRLASNEGRPIPVDLPLSGRPAMAPAGAPAFNLTGRLAVEWRSFMDDSEAGEDFTQPALAARLKAERLWGQPLDFRLHLRSKYSQRSRALDSERPQDEWLHRVYEAALVWNCPKGRLRASAGRLYSSDLPGAGNWDGGELLVRLNPRWSVAALAGTLPGLTDSSFDKDKQGYGAYALFAAGEPGVKAYRGSLGWVGQYDGHLANREFVTTRNSLRYGAFTLMQLAELDLNRDWREEAAGESTTLSRFNAGLYLQATPALRLNLSYDRWEPVRTLWNREIPDSLYALTLQQGLKGGASLRLPHRVTVGGSLGYRDREDEDRRPIFASGDLGFGDIGGSGVDAAFHYAYADGRFARSHVPSLDLSRAFGHRVDLGLGLGLSRYEGVEAESDMADLEGQWLRVYGGWRLSRVLDLQGIFGHTGGDIGAGNLIQMRLAYRL
jgi:hypothetical protein